MRLPLFESLGAVAIGLLGAYLIYAAVGRTSADPLGSNGRVLGAAVPFDALLAGAGFAAAWTPCIGPVLAEILMYAGLPGTAYHGGALLAIYTLGLLAPFLAVAAAAWWGVKRLSPEGRWRVRMAPATGAILLLIAGLLLTGRFALLTAYLSRFRPIVDLGL